MKTRKTDICGDSHARWTKKDKQSTDSIALLSRSAAARWWRISRTARRVRRSLCVLAAALAAAPVQAHVSPLADSVTAIDNTNGGTGTREADPKITVTAARDTLFASLEHLDLVLTREAGNRLNRLVVTVKLAQDEQWLADRSREVTFGAGDTIADLRIPASDFNERVTRSGDLTATVDDVSGYSTANTRATVFVVSSQGPVVTYSLSQPSYSFEEDVGRARAELVARMAPGMPRGVTVGASIALTGKDTSSDEFTATPGEDYEVVSGTVLMVADKYRLEGESWVGRTGVILLLFDDDVREGTETFELSLQPPPEQSGKARLQNPDGSSCTPRCRHLIHITDEEDRPALDLSVSSATILERGETSAAATVSITDSKSFAADQVLTLDFGGTATRGLDYVVSPADADEATSGYQLTLPAASSSAGVTLKAMADEVHDPNEKIEIMAMHEGTAVGALQAIRIADDGTVSIEVAQPSVAENGGTIGYTITALTGGDLQPGPGFSMEVPVATADGSAHAEVDFVAVSNTVTFGRADFSRTEIVAGSGDYRWVVSKRGEVTIVDDETVEQEERFTIALDAPSASSGFIAGTASAEVAITNEDRWGFQVNVSPESIREGDETEVTLTLRVVDKNGRVTEDGHCVAEFPVTAALVLGGSASDADDYSYTVTNGDLSSVRLAGCQPSRRVTLRMHALTDDESEGTEEVTFTPTLVNTRLLDPDPALHRPGSLGIENVMGPPRVSFSRSSSTFAETAQDADVVMVARTASGAAGGTPVTFSVSSRGKTAASGEDFRPVSEVVTLREQDYTAENGAWVARHRLPLTLLDDRVREGTEMLDLVLEQAPGQTTGLKFSNPDGTRCADPCKHPVHITDDEDMPELELSIDEEEIGEEQGSSVTVTISITNGTTFSTDQIFTITFGGNATQGIDYEVIPSDADTGTPGHQVTLPAGSISVEVTITALEDDDEDPDEEFELHVTLGDETVGGVTIPIRDRPLGPEVEITFEEVLSPRNGYDAGIVTGPFTTRIAFSERVEGFSQEDITWPTHAGTTVDSTNIGVILWDYTEVRAGLEYTVRMMPNQNGRLHILVEPGMAVSVARGYGNQLGHNSLQVELPADRMMVAPAALTVDEGDADGAAFLVTLTSAPTGTVTVTTSGMEGAAVEVNWPALEIRPPYWTGGSVVTVTAGTDANTRDESVTLTVSASGGGYDGQTATVVVTVRDTGASGASANDGDGEDDLLAVVEHVTPEEAAAALFGEEGLSEPQLDALDLLGNRNGGYDLGDMLSWTARCRRGGVSCGAAVSAVDAGPTVPSPARPSPRRGGQGRRRRTGSSGPGRRRARDPDGGARGRAARNAVSHPARRGLPGARSATRWLQSALLAAVAVTWGCGVGDDIVEPRIPGDDPAELQPGHLQVRLTVPPGARVIGAMLVIEGPGIDSLQAPGLELIQLDESSAIRREVVVAGDLVTGSMLQVWVPHVGDYAGYRVSLLQVAGEDYTLGDLAQYRAAITR